MPTRHRLLTLLTLGLAVLPAGAHFNMLLPGSPSAKRGEKVTLVYQWGHPFEHQLFKAPVPKRLQVRQPDGKTLDLSLAPTLDTRKTADAKSADVFTLDFKPDQRGDYVFTLETPPIWMEEDQEFLQDCVKVVLYVQAEKGWDAAAGQAFEMTPLTRPYGLEPGMVFQARAMADGRSVADALVEIERYNPAPPAIVPPNVHITRTAKTDPNGLVTCTLTSPGWWGVTAQRENGRQARNGKPYPVRQRATIWVYVDAPAEAKTPR